LLARAGTLKTSRRNQSMDVSQGECTWKEPIGISTTIALKTRRIINLLIRRSKELIFDMPLIQIIPVEANKLKLKDSLRTPVYVTQNRRNAMGVGLVFEADLRTDEHPSHWILKGVCLCLNVDY
jgi:hypothetical protein